MKATKGTILPGADVRMAFALLGWNNWNRLPRRNLLTEIWRLMLWSWGLALRGL